MMTSLILRRFTVGGYGINGYLVADPETGIGSFIDPGGFNIEIESFINEREILLKYLFFTHGHWDHTGGLPDFKRRFQAETYAGKGELSGVNHQLKGGEVIEVGNLRFRAISIPGHTPHGISFYGHGCLFTGDALFCGSVGGTSIQKEAQRQVEHIRQHLFTLPDETMVFPAHGPITTIGVERNANPFF